jgi:hypothetical protein
MFIKGFETLKYKNGWITLFGKFFSLFFFQILQGKVKRINSFE